MHSSSINIFNAFIIIAICIGFIASVFEGHCNKFRFNYIQLDDEYDKCDVAVEECWDTKCVGKRRRACYTGAGGNNFIGFVGYV
mmetsp:Transcript_7203/g.26981  ORF Transcript_7203/g.26981 Transcript_7203/m.26981 type:complete len:84 (+) Transcript_7203:130-381(+)